MIEETQSPWASPVVIVPKKEIIIDKKTGECREILAPRLCIDYRKLNGITKKDAHPMPLVDDLLETIGDEPEYFTSLDLYSGYFQIPLTKEASEKSAFVTPDGQYKYLRMPFGMCNAPATFQRIMNTIFKDLIGKCMTVYTAIHQNIQGLYVLLGRNILETTQEWTFPQSKEMHLGNS